MIAAPASAVKNGRTRSNESEGGGGAGGENQEDESSDIVGAAERAQHFARRSAQNGANLLAQPKA